MKKANGTWQMVGLMFTAILGTLLHFFFDWTGGSAAAALVSAVNESIWEHTKLLFYPMVLFALMEYKAWGRGVNLFWCIKLMGVLVGLVSIPVLYYTYTGILGKSADWFNIAIFFIVAAAVYYMETKLFQKSVACRYSSRAAVSVLALIAAVYTLLTFYPPRIPWFQDPVSRTYGFFQSQ